MSFISLELHERYSKSQIVLTPGNNDDDCGDYNSEAGGPFLSDTAWTARGLVREGGRFMGKWKSLGSYTLNPRHIKGLRIVSVNSVFFSNKYQS